MSVYTDVLHAAECGRKFRINLKDKTLKIDNREIYLEDRDNLIDVKDLPNGFETLTPWQILEQLYIVFYKKSVPSARYNGNRPYFKAENVENLTDNEIAFGAPRDITQCMIEAYVLLAGLSGLLVWQNEEHWFWQGNDKELIVLREWIE